MTPHLESAIFSPLRNGALQDQVYKNPESSARSTPARVDMEFNSSRRGKYAPLIISGILSLALGIVYLVCGELIQSYFSYVAMCVWHS